MRIVLFILLATLYSVNSDAQNYLLQTKKWIIDDLLLSKDSGYTLSLIDTTTSYVAINHLGATISGYEHVELDLYFGRYGQICDSEVIRFQCDTCATFHLADIKNNKKLKWKQIDDTTFFSPKWYSWFTKENERYYSSPWMHIHKHPGELVCTIVIMSLRAMKEDEWKSLKKRYK